MSIGCAVSFASIVPPSSGTLVLLAGEGGTFGPLARSLDEQTGNTLSRAVKAADFKGKSGASLDLWAPGGLSLDRIVLVGIGKLEDKTQADWTLFGGTLFKKVAGLSGGTATMVLEAAEALGTEACAQIALGARLASYRFDKYKSRKASDGKAPNGKNGGGANGKDERDAKGPEAVVLAVGDVAAAKKAYAPLAKVADGVFLARDLVNEPANMLGPVEFADRAKALERLGVEVEILGEREMKKLKMNALLGVAQGSPRPPRLVVMRWNGAKAKDKPLAFIGKGVVFDTGGNSMKPAAGMEDMKGDMGGAACVLGLMHALAARGAKVNAVGAIALVENMVDGNAQRPGDIVTSMSGQTIEVLNTDAEGRLVLADALWYVQDRYKPQFMIDLATLTGAIIVALGHHHAGLFASDDALADALIAAGEATGEKVWRMPLGKEYDKMIDSKTADMKNIGGRQGGSITAAQFLKRFVNDVPWAHLDVAGTAMGAPQTDINPSWGSGYGVRLLDRLVAENHEKRG